MNHTNKLRTVVFSILTFASLFFISCKNETVNDNVAIQAVEEYIRLNPVYETTQISYGKVKLRAKKDAEKLTNYKELEKKDYLDLELEKGKKRFLSKDSVFTYIISFTDKSTPYILKKGKNTATVRAFDYILDDEKPVNVEETGKTTAKVTVALKKRVTDFAVLADDKNPHASFMTKSYKLKHKEETGWLVVK